jgi:formylglycine-generating enzyme required for sulfatase activity
VVGEEAHANRLALKTGGPEYVAVVSSSDTGNALLVKNLVSGKPEEVLKIADVPAGADYVTGNFRGTPVKDFIFYTSGESNLVVRAVDEAGGKFTTAVAKTVTLPRPIMHLTSLPGGKKTRLLAVFGDQEPAEVMDFDGANPPVTFQKLAGATNKCLKGGVALPDGVVLFSVETNFPPKPALRYQVHLLKGDSYVPGAYGGLPDLNDRDDATIPDIYARIITNSAEKTTADMKPYTNTIPGTEATYEMVPIPAGEFVIGSPESESKRKPDEGPQHRVKISPFWMGKYEVTWDQYFLFMYSDDEKKQREEHPTPEEVNKVSDAVTRPSKPYVPMDFGMGKSGFPAIAMTHHAANKFCHWLSAKTGHFYRLPTEAEWEYACRAGTTNAYSFGDDPKLLPDYGWFFDNSDSKYQKIGRKKPNPWGLYDMHGNVMEWVLDQYAEDTYQKLTVQGVIADPWNRATQPYPHAARGGSWDDDSDALRSAARRGSERTWKATDPQLPKSIWYLSDSKLIGFRIVRPLTVPNEGDMKKYWISGVEKD